MAGQEDDFPVIAPLFVGLTRPTLIKGIPFDWFGITFIASALALLYMPSLLSKAVGVIVIGGGLYVLGWKLTERDPHWMRIFTVKFGKTGPTKTRSFWKCNSYAP